MLGLGADSGPLSLLCLGAHADDIEIGCGGTLLRVLSERPGCTVRWVVFSAIGDRATEARASANRFLGAAASRHVEVLGFRDGYFPEARGDLKDYFEALKQEPQPDLILTHYREDRHQDHRVVGDLTWQTFRNHLVLEYEVPKYDGDLGHPNAFVAVPEPYRRLKVEYLLQGFPSQREKPWFTAETFQGLMRLRGIEAAVAEGYAEAFYTRKAVLTL